MAKEVWAPWGSEEAYLGSLVDQGLHPQLLGNAPAAVAIMAEYGYEPPTGPVGEAEVLAFQAQAASAGPAAGGVPGAGLSPGWGVDEFTTDGGLAAIPGWIWVGAIAGLAYLFLRKRK